MLKRLVKKIWFVTLVISYSIPPTIIFANSHPNNSVIGIPNPLGSDNDTLISFITLLLDTIFPIASIVAIFFLIYSGFLMVMAGGNEEKLSKAKTGFLWVVIGIGILLGAKVLSAVICGTVSQLITDGLSCPEV